MNCKYNQKILEQDNISISFWKLWKRDNAMLVMGDVYTISGGLFNASSTSKAEETMMF